MRFTKTLRFRLIVVTVLCTAAVSLVGNLALFGYLNNILTQRTDRIDEIYLSTLQNQLDEYLTDLSDLAILCSSDYTVSRALSPAATMKNAVDAQDRLNARLRRIAANDFSFDPEIEKPQDELGQIGRTVNEMSMSIQHLLQETEEMYTQRRNIEIALLQSQVNPHFLYNTLDSIRWMAVIQKNPGIASITHSLSNLLKNIAKGTQDKITLAEELGLLQDYIAIQAVRYVEMFTFVDEVPQELYACRIVKLTLQPLVENAIFHGIEPTGECGTITLTGRAEGDGLYLCVEDDGAGIEPERLATILTAESKRSGSSMNGIGIANVHKRLQLIYGRQYGLTVESEPGRYTRVTVHIPREV